jgi:signal transduction histidine kinase
VETSRQAGMAEVATGVLHNVGNVLNSVNVSATVLADSVKQTKALSLKRVVDLLEANKSDLPALFAAGGKGQMLPGYLATLTSQLVAEQETRLAELDQLTKNISHIKDIVAMQQNYAKVTGVLEDHSPRVLLDEALQLSSAENKRAGVTLEFDCAADIPEVYVDRHKVMQILVNLLTNARQAMLDQPVEERLVFVSVELQASVVRISIRDNGCGISGENLTRIFNHGFTTKKNGHGFGLHSAANAAKEMGGGLCAESEGVGYGAIFHLDLPIKQAARVETRIAA